MLWSWNINDDKVMYPCQDLSRNTFNGGFFFVVVVFKRFHLVGLVMDNG